MDREQQGADQQAPETKHSSSKCRTKMDLTTPSESLRRWESLLSIPNSSRIRQRRPSASTGTSTSKSTGNCDANRRKKVVEEADPFDCSDVAVPPPPDQVEGHVRKTIARWRDLDARRVIPEPAAAASSILATNRTGTSTSTITSNNGSAAKKGGDRSRTKNNNNNKRVRIDEEPTVHEMDPTEAGASTNRPRLRKRLVDKRVRLPANFNVMGGTTAIATGPPAPDIARRRDQVISLADPTKLLDYETELHRLFDTVPMEEEVEDDATAGSVCTNTLALKAENEEGVRDYTRFDGHALGRMRLRDRHGLPSRVWSSAGQSGEGNDTSTSTTGIANKAAQQPRSCRGVAIRVECWRRMAKRGSTPDCHRLELELWGEQTLEDLHRLLLELGRGASGVLTLADGSGSYDGRTKLLSSSGMFFIEDTFYVCGDEDYSAPIIDWLDGPDGGKEDCRETEKVEGGNKGGTDDENPIYELRKNFLGLPIKSSKERRTAVPMSTVRLDSLPFRMEHRYLHVSDGDREVSLFFTDVRVVLSGEDTSRYPLVHDVWITSSSQPDCAGCEQRPAIIMTYQNELTNGQLTPLCEQCFRMLHYDKDGKVRPGSGGGNMRVLPLAMVMGWDDCWVSSEKPCEPF